MKRIRLHAITGAAALCFSSASLLQPGVASAANERSYEIASVIAAAPPGGDWQILKRNLFGLTFHRGEADGTDSIAAVNVFVVESDENAERFAAEVKRNVAEFLRAPRTTIVSVSFTPTQERDAPCVRVRAMAEVSIPPGMGRAEPVVPRPMRILLCRHAGESKLGYMIAFSYTATAPTEPFESQAQAFEDGVRPNPKLR